MENLKEKTVKGVVWSAFNRFSTQGISFAFNILIARMLLPEDYGAVAMLNIFISISSCFVDSGFANALIRKIDRTEKDFSTVFYYNLVVALLFYFLLWVAAPFIANFYNIPILKDVTKVLGLGVVIGAIQGIMGIKLTIALDFKTFAKISVPTNILIGVISLLMAYTGFGIWALVFPNLIAGIFKIFILWYYVRWLPTWTFSWESFKEMFSYGSKLLTSSILDKLYNSLNIIVVGKIFNASSLGVYSRAYSFAALPSSNVTNILQNVTFPVLSSIQNETERLESVYRRFVRMSVFIIFPLMMGLSAVADPFIRILLTDKWEGAIHLLQIISFEMIWYPLHAINLNLLQVKGRSDYFLKLEVIKKLQGVLVLCLTAPLGLVAMCYGSVFCSFVNLIWNTYYTNKIIGYGYWCQMRDIMPILLHSLVMFIAVHIAVCLIPTLLLKLIVGIAVGMTYYIGGAYIMKFKEVDETLSILKIKKNR